GEHDDCFVHENIVLVCEYTVGSSGSEHLLKKKILFDLVNDNQANWVTQFSQECPAFGALITSSAYPADQYRIRIVYISSAGVSAELEANCPNVIFLDGAKLRYFDALSKTIRKSARHELFK